jgi:hypothetical protein
MSTDSTELLRQQINAMLQRVPRKVNAGGQQTAIEFKRFHAQIKKTMAKPRLTPEQMLSAYNQVTGWYSA